MSSNPAFELDQDTTARFGALVEAARAAISAHEQHEAERRAIAERDALLRRRAPRICERLESTRAEHALDEIEKARSEWEGLPGPSKQEREDERMRARFEEACRQAAERHQNSLERERIHARLGELSVEAEKLSLDETLVDDGVGRGAA